MKKWIMLCGFLMAGCTLWGAGLDLEICGWKLFDFSFDVNPFSRDDGRSKVYVPSHAPTYYALPPETAPVPVAAVPAPPAPAASVPPIQVQNSSNVQVVVQEAPKVPPPVVVPAPVVYVQRPQPRYYYTYYPGTRYCYPNYPYNNGYVKNYFGF